MYCVIIEILPLLGDNIVIDVFPLKVGGSRIGIKVLKLLVVGEPANNFWYINVFVCRDVSPSGVWFSNPDRFSFKFGEESTNS